MLRLIYTLLAVLIAPILLAQNNILIPVSPTPTPQRDTIHVVTPKAKDEAKEKGVQLLLLCRNNSGTQRTFTADAWQSLSPNEKFEWIKLGIIISDSDSKIKPFLISDVNYFIGSIDHYSWQDISEISDNQLLTPEEWVFIQKNIDYVDGALLKFDCQSIKKHCYWLSNGTLTSKNPNDETFIRFATLDIQNGLHVVPQDGRGVHSGREHFEGTVKGDKQKSYWIPELIKIRNTYGFNYSKSATMTPIQYTAVCCGELDSLYHLPLTTQTEWIPTQKLMSVCQMGKWGYIDSLGECVVPLKYEYVEAFGPYNRPIIVKRDNKYGCISSMDNLIIPFRYDSIVNDTLLNMFLCRRNARYDLIKYSGEILLSDYDAVERHPSSGRGENNEISKYYQIRKNRKYGCLYQDGRTILPCNLDSIDLQYWGAAIYFVAKRDNQFGCFDSNGKKVIPFIYSNIIFSGNCFFVEQDGKEGVLNRNYQLELPLIYDQTGVVCGHGWNCSRTDCELRFIVYKDNGWTLLDGNKRPISQYVFDSIWDVGKSIYVVSLNKKWGAINNKGRIIVPFKYTSISGHPRLGFRFENGGSSRCYYDSVGIRHDYFFECGEDMGRAVNGDTSYMWSVVYDYIDKSRYDKAVEWWKKAANLGCINAILDLDKWFNKGWLIGTNYKGSMPYKKEAKYWHDQAEKIRTKKIEEH